MNSRLISNSAPVCFNPGFAAFCADTIGWLRRAMKAAWTYRSKRVHCCLFHLHFHIIGWVGMSWQFWIWVLNMKDVFGERYEKAKTGMKRAIPNVEREMHLRKGNWGVTMSCVLYVMKLEQNPVGSGLDHWWLELLGISAPRQRVKWCKSCVKYFKDAFSWFVYLRLEGERGEEQTIRSIFYRNTWPAVSNQVKPDAAKSAFWSKALVYHDSWPSSHFHIIGLMTRAWLRNRNATMLANLSFRDSSVEARSSVLGTSAQWRGLWETSYRMLRSPYL